jgi:hypothetical protein
MHQISIKDIKIVLFGGYILAYLLAIFAPIVIDPQLASHVLFPNRVYPYKLFCLPILFFLVTTQAIFLLKRAQTTKQLYASIVLFLFCIGLTVPVFLPEFPHGNVIIVGVATAILSALTAFVWSIGTAIVPEEDETTAGRETIDYIKSLLTFVRQGAFAGVTLFGALFFAGYSTGFSYVESTVDPKAKYEIFLLKVNVGLQVGFFGLFSVVGILRYFFLMTLGIMKQFKRIAARLDTEAIQNTAIKSATVGRSETSDGSEGTATA